MDGAAGSEDWGRWQAVLAGITNLGRRRKVEEAAGSMRAPQGLLVPPPTGSSSLTILPSPSAMLLEPRQWQGWFCR